jgi:hypothetical protein
MVYMRCKYISMKSIKILIGCYCSGGIGLLCVCVLGWQLAQVDGPTSSAGFRRAPAKVLEMDWLRPEREIGISAAARP